MQSWLDLERAGASSIEANNRAIVEELVDVDSGAGGRSIDDDSEEVGFGLVSNESGGAEESEGGGEEVEEEGNGEEGGSDDEALVAVGGGGRGFGQEMMVE